MRHRYPGETTTLVGVVLDPFAGSGTTLLAAKEEGFSYVGIEANPDYIEIAKARLEAVEAPAVTLESFTEVMP